MTAAVDLAHLVVELDGGGLYVRPLGLVALARAINGASLRSDERALVDLLGARARAVVSSARHGDDRRATGDVGVRGKLVTTGDAAAMLGVDVRTVQRVAERELGGQLVGGRWFVDSELVAAWRDLH